nr:MAG: putative RNA-dependent RNA polymerase [Guangxi cysto-like virus 1]
MCAVNRVDFVPFDHHTLNPLFKGLKGSRLRAITYKEGPTEPLWGVYSDDLRLLWMKTALAKDLTEQFPESVDRMGRTFGNAVRSNFYGLQHVTGYSMLPGTFPLHDNRYLREQNGLSNKFVKPWHRNVFRAIIKKFFTDLEYSPVPVKNGSSSMAPFFTSARSQKSDLMAWAIKNAPRASRMISNGDVVEAFTRFGVGGVNFGVYRDQSSDKIDFVDGRWVAKARPVADLEYAATGGMKGTFLPADKRIVIEGGPDGLFRTRKRIAMGTPLGTNAPLMTIAHPVRKKIYRVYPFTYHHTTRERLRSELRKWEFMIAADVSNHDWFWPTWFIDEVADILRDLGYADWWVDLYVMKGKMRTFVTSVGPGIPAGVLGDWTDYSSYGGLPSGNAFTDIEGTYGMTFVYLVLLIEHIMPEMIDRMHDQYECESFVESVLQGEAPVGIKDKSDDALLLARGEPYVTRLRNLQEEMIEGKEDLSPYFKISYEHGGAFLGNIIVFPESGNMAEIDVVGNINSFVINQFSPEYSINSRVVDRSTLKRPYPGLAWGSYADVYGTTPTYHGVLDCIEKHFYDAFGTSYRSLREHHLEKDRLALRKHLSRQDLAFLTTVEAEVLAEPAKLQYKYTEDDVRPAIVNLLFHSLDTEDTRGIFNSITKDVL